MNLNMIDYAMIGFVAVAWIAGVWYARKKRRESAERLADLQQRTINYFEHVKSQKAQP